MPVRLHKPALIVGSAALAAAGQLSDAQAQDVLHDIGHKAALYGDPILASAGLPGLSGLAGFAGGAKSDPYWSDVVFLASLEGANGGTTWSDLSNVGASLTRRGATVATTTSYGPTGGNGSSTDFPGTVGNDLVTNVQSEYNFSTGGPEFTAECWVRFDALSAAAHPFFCVGGTTGAGGITLGTNITGQAKMDNGAAANITGSAGDYVIGTWHHVAGVRDGSTWRLYVDGSQIGTGSPQSIPSSSNIMRLGGFYTVYATNGQIAWARVTKNVCRYPSGTSFTPPALPLPSG